MFGVGLGLVVAALARAGAAVDAKRAAHEATRWGVGRSCGHALHVTYAGCAHFPAHGCTEECERAAGRVSRAHGYFRDR
jgi:hypothetical protein